MLVGVAGSVICAVEFVPSMSSVSGDMDGGLVSIILVGCFSALVVSTSIGLFRARAWARWVACLLAVLFGLYCLSFVLMVGPNFGYVPFSLSFIGIAFTIYAFLVALLLRYEAPQSEHVVGGNGG